MKKSVKNWTCRYYSTKYFWKNCCCRNTSYLIYIVDFSSQQNKVLNIYGYSCISRGLQVFCKLLDRWNMWCLPHVLAGGQRGLIYCMQQIHCSVRLGHFLLRQGKGCKRSTTNAWNSPYASPTGSTKPMSMYRAWSKVLWADRNLIAIIKHRKIV